MAYYDGVDVAYKNYVAISSFNHGEIVGSIMNGDSPNDSRTNPFLVERS